jgi:hypothetical protein
LAVAFGVRCLTLAAWRPDDGWTSSVVNVDAPCHQRSDVAVSTYDRHFLLWDLAVSMCV